MVILSLYLHLFENLSIRTPTQPHNEKDFVEVRTAVFYSINVEETVEVCL